MKEACIAKIQEVVAGFQSVRPVSSLFSLDSSLLLVMDIVFQLQSAKSGNSS